MVKPVIYFSIAVSIIFCIYTLNLYGKLPRTQSQKQEKTTVQKVEDHKILINRLYDNISGFSISSDEQANITKEGGSPTYGEITYDGLQLLLNDLNVTKNDVFYDLGCGIGKACIQVSLNTQAKKSVGIELSPTRIAHAKRAREKLMQEKKLAKYQKLNFIEDNITRIDLSDATLIFMNSTCFSSELMQAVVNKLAQCKNGLRVMTQKQLPEHKQFKLLKEYRIPMTWSSNVAVYVYRLEK